MRKWFLLSVGCCLFSWAVAQEATIKRSVSRFVSLLTYIDEQDASDIAYEYKGSGSFIGNGERTTLVAFLEKYKRHLNGIPMTHEISLYKGLVPIGDGMVSQCYRVSGKLRRYRSDRDESRIWVGDVSFVVKYNGPQRPVTLIGCNLPFIRMEGASTVSYVPVSSSSAEVSPPERVDWSAFKNYTGLGKLLKSQMDLFCKYVSEVGSTNLPDEYKERIVEQAVPGLFYNYEVDPRMMITSVAYQGSGRVRKPIYAYFENLKIQARKGAFVKRVYELSSCFSSGNVNELPELQFVRKLSDGSLLYRTSAVYDQVMYDVDTSRRVEGRVIRRERDRKRMELLLVIKPNRRIGVYLGDIVEVKRIN